MHSCCWEWEGKASKPVINTPSFEQVYSFSCGPRRVTVTQNRMICFVPLVTSLCCGFTFHDFLLEHSLEIRNRLSYCMIFSFILMCHSVCNGSCIETEETYAFGPMVLSPSGLAYVLVLRSVFRKLFIFPDSQFRISLDTSILPSWINKI